MTQCKDRRSLSPEERAERIDRVESMWRAGMTQRLIAEETGLSASTVNREIQRLKPAEPHRVVGDLTAPADVINAAGIEIAVTSDPNVPDVAAGEVLSEIVEDLTAEEARALTDRIRAALEDTWELIVEAYTRRVWIALGHKSWDAWCAAESPAVALRIPREDRPERVRSLRKAGLSIRAIEAATGLGYGTIHRELSGSGDPNGSPEETSPPPGTDNNVVPITTAPSAKPITGRDGKKHAATKKRKRETAEERNARILSNYQNQYSRAAIAVTEAVAHLDALTKDSRFESGHDAIRNEHLATLRAAVTVLSKVANTVHAPAAIGRSSSDPLEGTL
jgi:DNA invertase Pin-like site-specific DNA recombinase